MCVAEKRENYEEKEKKTVHWSSHRLVGSTTGGRWKPMSRTEEGKNSFSKCVSVSDLGFAVCLLCHYSKMNSGDTPNEGEKIGESTATALKHWANAPSGAGRSWWHTTKQVKLTKRHWMHGFWP